MNNPSKQKIPRALSVESIAQREGVSVSDILVELTNVGQTNGKLLQETVYRLRPRGVQRLFSEFTDTHGIDDPRVRLALQATMIRQVCPGNVLSTAGFGSMRDRLFSAWSETMNRWERMLLLTTSNARSPMKRSRWSRPQTLSNISSCELPNSKGCIAVTPHRLDRLACGEVLLLDADESIKVYVENLRSFIQNRQLSQPLAWLQLSTWSRLFGPTFTNVRWAVTSDASSIVLLLRDIWQPHFCVEKIDKRPI